MIDRSKLTERVVILGKNNGSIAKWIDCRYEDRALAMKDIAQTADQLSIIGFI